jgi:hypothetical protein
MQVTGVTAVMSNLNHFFCDRRTSTGASGRGGASQRVRSTQRSGAGCLGSFSCRSIGLYHVCLCLENPGTIFLLKTKFLDNYHHFLPRNYIFWCDGPAPPKKQQQSPGELLQRGSSSATRSLEVAVSRLGLRLPEAWDGTRGSEFPTPGFIWFGGWKHQTKSISHRISEVVLKEPFTGNHYVTGKNTMLPCRISLRLI